ncbi:hypothetical protein IFM89_012398, partial [Coptis chinensis]
MGKSNISMKWSWTLEMGMEKVQAIRAHQQHMTTFIVEHIYRDGNRAADFVAKNANE